MRKGVIGFSREKESTASGRRNRKREQELDRQWLIKEWSCESELKLMHVAKKRHPASISRQSSKSKTWTDIKDSISFRKSLHA